MVAYTIAFLKVSSIIAITSLLNFFSLIESYLDVLRAAIAYRYCTIKSHNGKSRCRQYMFRKSSQYGFVTSHWH